MPKVYGASDTKKPRSTKVQMTEFRRAIFDIVEKHRPCTNRQVYYRAVVAGLVGKDVKKSRKNETRVTNALSYMREEYVNHAVSSGTGLKFSASACRRLGIMPFEWVTDDTRTRFQSRQHSDRDEALRLLHAGYRRDLWQTQPRHVEVWCESSSIAGVLLETTDEYGVALLPCRGQAGKRYVWDSARAYARMGRPITCLYVGDFDPAGLDIGNSVRERLLRYMCGVDVDFEFRRIGITASQVSELGLPGHGLNPNTHKSQLARFHDECDKHGLSHEAVEAEAMDPTTMRTLVADAIDEYIDPRQWEIQRIVEASERRDLWDMIGNAS